MSGQLGLLAMIHTAAMHIIGEASGAFCGRPGQSESSAWEPHTLYDDSNRRYPSLR
jgi:hypothetical protein